MTTGLARSMFRAPSGSFRAPRGSTLVLVRHGETEANAARIFQGAFDSPLTPLGRRQVARAARLLAGVAEPAALYASPLGRAFRSAQVIALELRMGIFLCEAFAEVDLGAWEGLAYEVLHEQHRFWDCSRADADFAPHGGESPRQLGRRVCAGFLRVAHAQPGARSIVVGHGGAFCAGLARLLGTDPLLGDEYAMRNGAITELRFAPEPEIVCLNATEHLDGLDATSTEGDEWTQD